MSSPRTKGEGKKEVIMGAAGPPFVLGSPSHLSPPPPWPPNNPTQLFQHGGTKAIGGGKGKPQGGPSGKIAVEKPGGGRDPSPPGLVHPSEKQKDLYTCWPAGVHVERGGGLQGTGCLPAPSLPLPSPGAGRATGGTGLRPGGHPMPEGGDRGWPPAPRARVGCSSPRSLAGAGQGRG